MSIGEYGLNLRYLSSIRRAFHRARAFALCVGIFSFFLYYSTLSPSWGFVDGGELSAAASTLGISHPTGYPTTVILGYVAVLVSPARDVVTLNVLAALFTALSVSLLFLLSLEFLRRAQGLESQEELPTSSLGIAAIAALLTGSGLVWWSQGTGFEVYAFHLAATLFTARLFLRFVEDEKKEESKDERKEKKEGFIRSGNAFALMLGICFTTHLTIVFWLPAFALYYFGAFGFSGRSFRRLARLLPAFAVGLLPYLFLPIRALTDPVLNWGDPDSPGRFYDHVTGAIFRDVMFSGGDAFSRQISWFFRALVEDFLWVGPALALVGLVTLFRRHRLAAVWSVALFAVTVLWSSGYAILDVEPYFLPAFVAVGLWCAVGLDLLRSKVGKGEAIAAGVILVCVGIVLHYEDADRTGNRYSEDMTMNVLTMLPDSAVILSSDWDFWLSGSLYAQHVEQVRPDVDVVYITLLQYKWYRDELERRRPELMRGLEQTSREYEQVLETFLEEGGNESPLNTFLVRIANGIVDNAIPRRPVFVSGGTDPQIGTAYDRAPNYLALRLVPDGSYLPQEFPRYRFNPVTIRVDPYVAMVHELYARSYIARGIYEEQFGNLEMADRYYRAAFGYDPDYLTEDVPDFPLNGEDQIGATERFFDEARAMIGRKK